MIYFSRLKKKHYYRFNLSYYDDFKEWEDICRIFLKNAMLTRYNHIANKVLKDLAHEHPLDLWEFKQNKSY